jgi:hypothetical protein
LAGPCRRERDLAQRNGSAKPAAATGLEALASLATLVAGSPLLASQRDPRPSKDHPRVPGFAEMASVFDFEAVFFANVPRLVYDYTANGPHV